MSRTESSIEYPIPDVHPAAVQGRRLRDVGMLSVPLLIIVIALYHLATCCNSPQPVPMGTRPHRTIRVVRADHSVPASMMEPQGEPSLMPDDDRAFDPAANPEPWPYGAGWR
jgi:hypothetical protein